MSVVARPACEPFFLASDGHSLFCLLFLPPAGLPRRGAILHVPAFAEEMNKSRRAVANTARALAMQGWFVLVTDPRGTGDSSGDFADASWDGWLADLRAAAHWLQERTGHVPALWGHRAGCLLVNELVVDIPARRALLWQPVLNGDAALTQFLRLRTMSGLADAGRQRESTTALVAQLEAGDHLEVAGYLLSPALALPFRRARVDVEHFGGQQIAWLEVSTAMPPQLAPASVATLDKLRVRARDVHTGVVSGVPFWTSQEIDEAPALTAATLSSLAAQP